MAEQDDNQEIDQNTGKDKPTIDKTPQYRYPKGFVKDGKKVGGQIMSREESERLKAEKSGFTKVSSGAVSNQQLQEYKQKLSRYEHVQYGQKFGQAFDKSSPDTLKREELSKLFESMASKISTNIGKVVTSLVEIKKENSASSTKLMNLTTSILATANSQRGTIDELYKIVDTKLSELVSKTGEKSAGKGGKSDTDGTIKVAGIIRGIGGLNKQLVAINSNMSKMVKMMSTILEKGGIGQKILPTITPEAEKEKIDTPQQLEKVSSTKVEKKQEVESRGATLLEGLLKIMGGTSLMTLAAGLHEFADNFDKYKSKFDSTIESISTLVNKIDGFANRFSEFFDNLDKANASITGQIMSLKTAMGLGNKSAPVEPEPTPKKSAMDMKKLGESAESSTSKESLSSKAKEFGKSAGSKLSELGKSVDSFVRKNSGEIAKSVKTAGEVVTAVAKKNPVPLALSAAHTYSSYMDKLTGIKSREEMLQGIIEKHASIDSAKKIDYSDFFPASKGTTFNPDKIVTKSIANSTEAVKMASNVIEDIKAERTGANKNVQSPVVINNNNVSNNNTAGTSGLMANVRNTDSTKSMLDRMSLLGGYTGIGYPVN